jgi:small subunit ribosomal protein S1
MRSRGDEDPPAKDHGPHTLCVWRGVVVGLFGDDVFVELGPRMQGVISRRHLAQAPEIGDAFDFTLRGQEEGLWALALSEQRPIATWESMEPGSLVHARVVRVAPGGLELKVGPLHAFMPKSHTGVARDEKPDGLVGKMLTCEVIEVDRERQRVLVSRKLVLQRERASEHQRAVGALKEGEVVQDRVTRIESYGAFVAFGHGMEGFVHVSNLSHERVEHPSALLKEGDGLDLRVLYVKKGGKRIGLGLKQMTESPWATIDKHCYVDQIVEGTVTRVVEFGAFVKIREGIEGLLHASEAGSEGDRRLRSFVAPGQRLSVRICEIDAESRRMSLSLVHRNGARITAEEAANAKTFAELAQANPDARLRLNLGKLLMRALAGSQPSTSGGAERELAS